jgi:uncharacterized protein with PQ loop repeat
VLIFSSIQSNHHRRYYPLYLFLIIACLLLGITNATNQIADNNDGLIDKVSTFATSLWKSLNEGSNDTSTTANETTNTTQTSIFHKPENMSDVRRMSLAFLRLLAQLFIIFGGVIPYIPQYLMIKRKQNAEGFSNYVCLTLLVANILRIEFWFGKHFETPLLLQSIVMIICMLIMLEIWTRVHARTMQNQAELSDQQDISTSKEQLTEDVYVKKFTDFEMNYFWRWTKFASYIQFLFLITLILSIITWVFIKNVVYNETIGFLAVFCEALLGMPQFIRNCRLKSTEGMSVKMVLLWAAGDIFKTVYFIFRDAPKQFWFCGILQISIDLAILCQVVIFATKYRFFREQ